MKKIGFNTIEFEFLIFQTYPYPTSAKYYLKSQLNSSKCIFKFSPFVKINNSLLLINIWILLM